MKKPYQRKKTPKPDDWKGILLEPMRPKAIHMLQSREEADLLNVKQLSERLMALFEQMGVDPSDDGAWPTLVCKLAERLGIPGFTWVKSGILIKKPGPAPGWNGPMGIKLYADVDAMKRNEDCSALQAINLLVKTEEYSSQKPNSLYARYKEVKKSFGNNGCKNLDIILQSNEPFAEQLIGCVAEDGSPLLNNLAVLECFSQMMRAPKKT